MTFETCNFSIDGLNELTSAGTTSYFYDANGKRNSMRYATGTDSQTTSDGTWTYTYDYVGNLIKKSNGASAEMRTYGYDNKNELIWVEQHATDGGTLEQRVTYSYDALGQRIQRTVTISGVFGARGMLRRAARCPLF